MDFNAHLLNGLKNVTYMNKMNVYKLRITITNPGDLSHIETLSNRYFDKYIVAREDWDNHPHVHFYIETSKTMSSIRQYITKYIGKGNGVYSLNRLKERHPIEYIAYITKQDAHFKSVGIPKEILEQAEAHKVEYRKKKKETARGIISNLLIELEGQDLDPSETTRWVVDHYIENGKIIRPHQMKDIVLTLLANKREDYRKSLTNSIIRNVQFELQ